MEQQKEYYAFISYKREDEKWAKWLQDKLEHYKFPTNLNGRTDLPKNIRPTFRDVTDLKPGLLAEEINDALRNSEWLIVVCSPRSAKSPWVCKEAQTFIDLGRADHIIPFVIEGHPFSQDSSSECYPESILNLTDGQELLAANINEMGRDAAVVKVVARMFGLMFDSLWQRHEKEKLRRRNWVIAITAFFIFAVLVVSAYIWRQNDALIKSRAELKAAFDDLIQANQETEREKNRAVQAERELANANDSLKIAFEKLICANQATEKEKDRALQAEFNLAAANDSLQFQYGLIEVANTNLQRSNIAKSLAQSRAAAEAAMKLVEEGNAYLGQKVALAALDLSYTSQAESVLRMANQSKSFILDHKYAKSIDISPKQNILVSTSGGKIYFWSMDAGMCLDSIECHSSKCISYSKSGNYLISASDSIVEIWDTRNKRLYNTLNTHYHETHCVGFSPVVESIVFTTSIDGFVQVWDLTTKKCVWSTKVGSFPAAKFSPDGTFLAITSWKEEINIWNIHSGRCVRKMSDTKLEWSNSIDYSNDGKYIVAASRNYVTCWDANSGECIYSKKAHGRYDVNSVRFTADSKYIISSGGDNNVCIWDTNTGDCVATLEGEEEELAVWNTCAVISRDNKQIITSSESYPIRSWDNPIANKTEWMALNDSFTHSASFSSDSKRIVTVSDANIFTTEIWNAETGESLIKQNMKTFYSSASFCNNDKYIALSGDNNDIFIYDASTLKYVSSLKGHKKWVSASCSSPDGRYILSSSRDSTIRIWDVIAERCVQVIALGTEPRTMSISDDNRHLCVADLNDSIKVYDVETKECLYRTRGFSGRILPDGRRIIAKERFSADWYLIDIDGNHQKMPFAGQTSSGLSAISSDGKYCVGVTGGNTIRVYDTASGICVYTMDGIENSIREVAFSPDTKKILVVSGNIGKVTIKDFDSLSKLRKDVQERFKGSPLSASERMHYYLE